MRWLFKLLGILAVLLIAVVIGLHFYIANADYKETLEAKASEALGRSVTITSVDNAGILPNPKFEVSGLTISNLEGMQDPYFAKVEKAAIGVKLMPLLAQQVEISNFTMSSPEVHLEKNAKGKVNWALGSNSSPASTENEGNSIVRDIKLGTVKLENGKITYRDVPAKQSFLAENANISLTLNSLSKPLTIKGDMKFQGKPAKLTASLTTPFSIMENKATDLALNFSVAENKVDTRINLKEGTFGYSGDLDIDAPSLKSLLATLGMPIDLENGFNNLQITGAVKGSATQMEFSNADIVFDDISTAGKTSVTFDWAGKRPKVAGTVSLNTLDLRPYLPAPSAESKANKNDKSAAFPAWPEDQIDFSPLKSFDVDLATSTKAILLHDMSIGQSSLDLSVANGKMIANLKEMNLYDGSGSGALHINARQKFPTIELRNINLTGMNAQRFATEVLGLNRIQGVGGVKANLTARGTSVADFMRTLTGNGSFDIDKGAVEGVDLGKLIRSANTLLSGFKGGSFNPGVLTQIITEANGPASTTQFTDLNSTFTANNGVIRANNILMKGPLFMIEGDGTVNLPNQRMNMTFTPTVFETIEAVTGRKLSLPILISGSFNNPKIGFDTEGLLRGVVEDSIKDAIFGDGASKELQGENLEDLLKNRAQEEITKQLFGTPSTPENEEPSEEGSEQSVEEAATELLLNSIFGGEKETD